MKTRSTLPHRTWAAAASSRVIEWAGSFHGSQSPNPTSRLAFISLLTAAWPDGRTSRAESGCTCRYRSSATLACTRYTCLPCISRRFERMAVALIATFRMLTEACFLCLGLRNWNGVLTGKSVNASQIFVLWYRVLVSVVHNIPFLRRSIDGRAPFA